jgi:hypothetical protein
MDEIKKLLERDDPLRRQLEPMIAVNKLYEQAATARKAFEELGRHSEVMKASAAFDNLRKAGVLESASQVDREFERLRARAAEAQNRFQLPEISQAATLLREFEHSGIREALKRYNEPLAEIQRAVERMRTPWLDAQNSLRSMQAFVELQGIGRSLQTLPAFDTTLTEAIRFDLGDWRRTIAFPDEIFTNASARTAFYAAQGLDLSLTAFPSAAFDQTLSIAGLERAPAPLLHAYSREAETATADDAEAGFQRTNSAHDELQRFESQLRKFIDEKMKAAFGNNWIKHQVPGPIRQEWIDKREKAKSRGEREWPLIAYADFTEYEPIITRKDNWQKVFESAFQRKESVRESFQRLYPIRICTMHSRVITLDDKLYLRVELHRLLFAIGVKTIIRT